MATTYKSVLIEQPADGDVVFLRRFTRDPPVLAAWSLNRQSFTLANPLTAVQVGGTNPGTHTLPLVLLPAPFTGSGWALNFGTYWLIFRNTGGTTWQLSETNLTTMAYFSNLTADPS